MGSNGYVPDAKALTFLVTPLAWAILAAWLVTRDGESGFTSRMAGTPGNKVEATIGQALGSGGLLVGYLSVTAIGWFFMNAAVHTQPIVDLAVFAGWGLTVGLSAIGVGLLVGALTREGKTPGLILATAWVVTSAVVPFFVFSSAVTPDTPSLTRAVWVGIAHLSPITWALNALDLFSLFVIPTKPGTPIAPPLLAPLGGLVLTLAVACSLRGSWPWPRDIPLSTGQRFAGIFLGVVVLGSTLGTGAIWWADVERSDPPLPRQASMANVGVQGFIADPGENRSLRKADIDDPAPLIPRDEARPVDLVLNVNGPPNTTVRFDAIDLRTDLVVSTERDALEGTVELGSDGQAYARQPLLLRAGNVDSFEAEEKQRDTLPAQIQTLETTYPLGISAHLRYEGGGAPVWATLGTGIGTSGVLGWSLWALLARDNSLGA